MSAIWLYVSGYVVTKVRIVVLIYIMKWHRGLSVVLLVFLTMAAMALIGGYGGGLGNPVVPDSSFIGTYNGTYFITLGDNFGENGTFSFKIDADGEIEGDLHNLTFTKNASLSGQMSSANTFVLDSIYYYTDSKSGQGSGALSRNGNSITVSGTFTLADGTYATFSGNK